MLKSLRRRSSDRLHHFTFPLAVSEGSKLLHIFTQTTVCLFYYNHPCGCVVLPHMVLICIPND